MANDLIRLGQLLGSNKNIVGNKYSDLVLETLGKVYIKTGNSSRVLNDVFKLLDKYSELDDKENLSKTIITEDISQLSYPGDGILIFDAKNKALYISYDLRYILILDSLDTEISSKYVKKTGDTMTGTLVIKSTGAPLIVASQELVKNLNAEYLGGYTASRFAVKTLNEKIFGEWSFQNKTTFNGITEFNNKTIYNDNLFIKNSDIVTTGSIGSPEFASGFGGYGWRFDATTNMLTVDYLVVRKAMQVFELVVNLIKATNGSLWVTDSGKIDKVWEIKYLNVNDENQLNNLTTDVWYIPVSSDNYQTVEIEGMHLCDSNKDGNDTVFHTYNFAVKFDVIPEIISADQLTYENLTGTTLDGTYIDEPTIPCTVTKLFGNLDYVYNKNTTPSFFSTNLKEKFHRDSIREIYSYYKYFGNTDDPYTSDTRSKKMYIVKMVEDTFPTFLEGDLIRCLKYQDENIKYYDALVGNRFDTYYYTMFVADSVFDKTTSLTYDENGDLVQIQHSDIKNNSSLYVKTLQDVESEKNYSDAYNIFIEESKKYTKTQSLLLTSALKTVIDPKYPILDWVLAWLNDKIGYDYDTYYNNQINNVTEEITDDSLILTTISPEDELVRIGHLWNSSRQNSVYITSSENYSPYVQTMSGIDRPDYSVLYTQPKFKTKKKIVQGVIKNLYYELYNSLPETISDLGYEITWTKLKEGESETIEGNYLTSDYDDSIVYTLNTEEIPTDDPEKFNDDFDLNTITLDNKYKKQYIVFYEHPTLNCEIESDASGNLLSTYSNHVRARFGRLDGIYHELFGDKQPYGYGLYGDNVFLTGEFFLSNGKAVANIGDEVKLEINDSFGKAGFYIKVDKNGKPYILLSADLVKIMTLKNAESALFTNGRIESSLIRVNELEAAQYYKSYIYKGNYITEEDVGYYEKLVGNDYYKYNLKEEKYLAVIIDDVIIPASVIKYNNQGILYEVLYMDSENQIFDAIKQKLDLYFIPNEYTLDENVESYKINNNGLDIFDMYEFQFTYKKGEDNYARTDEEILTLAIDKFSDATLIKRDKYGYIYSEIDTTFPFVKADSETGILTAYGAELLGGKLQLRDDYLDPSIKIDLGTNDGKPGLQVSSKSGGKWNLNTSIEGNTYDDIFLGLVLDYKTLTNEVTYLEENVGTYPNEITILEGNANLIGDLDGCVLIEGLSINETYISSISIFKLRYEIYVNGDLVLQSGYGKAIVSTRTNVPIDISDCSVQFRKPFIIKPDVVYNISYNVKAKPISYEDNIYNIFIYSEQASISVKTSLVQKNLVTKLYGNGLFVGTDLLNYFNIYASLNNKINLNCQADNFGINLSTDGIKLINNSGQGLTLNNDGINFTNSELVYKMPIPMLVAKYVWVNDTDGYMHTLPLGGMSSVNTETIPKVTIDGTSKVVTITCNKWLEKFNVWLSKCFITIMGSTINERTPLYATIWESPTIDFANDVQTIKIRQQDDYTPNIGDFYIKIEYVG